MNKNKPEILSPCILKYDNVIDYSEQIINIVEKNKEKWSIHNESPENWSNNKKVVGYDEYEIIFSFAEPMFLLSLGKNIFDVALNYAINNITDIHGFNSCIVRKYYTNQSFLELECGQNSNLENKITSILFLNNVHEGGDIIFKNFNLSVPATSSSMIVFPSNFAYSFKINKPIDNNSFVIISNFR